MQDYYRLCQKCANYSHMDMGHVYCIVCGSKLIDRCPQCANLIEYPTARYCPHCGEAVVHDVSGNSNGEYAVNHKKEMS